MADQAINALSTKTTPETSDQLLLVGAGEPQLIDYDKLADSILNKITSKNYALDAGQMTLLAALNKLNSDKQESLIKYIGTGPNSGKNESLPTYDFSNEDTGLYLAVASNGNAIDATNYGGLLGVVMHAKKYSSISLMTSIRMDGNNNELKFSVNGNILSSPSLSWYAEIRVYKININI